MNENEFWIRYFQSALFARHRAQAPKAGEVPKPDALFDPYLDAEDDARAPIKSRDEAVDRLVDLNATDQDHYRGGNSLDVTMQQGRTKGVTGLIRSFNDHSERVLNMSLLVALVSVQVLCSYHSRGQPTAKKQRAFEGAEESQVSGVR